MIDSRAVFPAGTLHSDTLAWSCAAGLLDFVYYLDGGVRRADAGIPGLLFSNRIPYAYRIQI